MFPCFTSQDNWEDEDNEEEKKDSEKPPEPQKSAASKKPKKNLAEKIQIQEEKEVMPVTLWKQKYFLQFSYMFFILWAVMHSQLFQLFFLYSCTPIIMHVFKLAILLNAHFCTCRDY